MPAITLPTDGGNAGTWGPILNTAINAINTAVDAVILSDAAKAADNTVVKLTGNQTVAGTKTFSSAPAVPDNSFALAKVSGLVTALASANLYQLKGQVVTSEAAVDPALPENSLVVVVAA